MKIAFEKETSTIFGVIHRPYFPVYFWSTKHNLWVEVISVVDSGADYTLLPLRYMDKLGVSKTSARVFRTYGVGGSSKVYLLEKGQLAKLANMELNIPVGFVDDDDVPPLLGRYQCLDKFKVIFEKHETEISSDQ